MRRAAAVIIARAIGPSAVLAPGRIVVEQASARPVLDADQAVLYVKRFNAMVGDCAVDGGLVLDSGSDPDSGSDLDSGSAPDSGSDPDAGPAPDAGPGDCSVIRGDAVTMVVQPRFTTGANGTRFALLLATPAPPLYSVESPDIFDELDAVTAARLEHVRVEVEDPELGTACQPMGCAGGTGEPQGCGAYEPAPVWTPPAPPGGNFGDGGVEVIPIGEYEIVRLYVADRAGLAAWLDNLGYAYTVEDLDAIEPYIARGDIITAVRVSVAGASDGVLRPLALTWAGAEFQVPLALVRPPPGTATAMTVYISADGRYQLPSASVPFAARTSWNEPSFLTRNDIVIAPDRTIATDPRATRILDDPEEIPVETVEDIVRVPVRVECDSELGCCSDCNSGRGRVRWDAIFVAAASLLVLRRRRRS